MGVLAALVYVEEPAELPKALLLRPVRSPSERRALARLLVTTALVCKDFFNLLRPVLQRLLLPARVGAQGPLCRSARCRTVDLLKQGHRQILLPTYCSNLLYHRPVAVAVCSLGVACRAIPAGLPLFWL